LAGMLYSLRICTNILAGMLYSLRSCRNVLAGMLYQELKSFSGLVNIDETGRVLMVSTPAAAVMVTNT